MKKQTMITLAFALTLTMPTLPSFAQKAMSKKEIAEKEGFQEPPASMERKESCLLWRFYHRSEHQGIEGKILGISAGLARHHPLCLWCERQTME